MEKKVKVALPKLLCWYDAARIQAWPSILAKVPRGEIFVSLTDFGRRYCSERMSDSEHLADHDYVRNMPGLERQGSRLVLRGVGLVAPVDGGYALSEYAQRLGDEYAQRPAEKEWVRQLVSILLTREPRTRLLVYYLSQPGAKIIFARRGWFRGSIRNVRIEGDQFEMYPFEDQAEHFPSLRKGLEELSWWALGAWRSSPLLTGATDCEWVGYFKPTVSLDRIGQALRGPCEALLYCAILRPQDDYYTFDHEAAIRELGKELSEDFGWMLPNPEKKSLLRILSEQVEILRSDTGYIVASELRGVLQSHGIENPDREIAELELAGRIAIDDACHGQRRHGMGLFADPGKQLVKLRIIGGEC